MNQPVPARKLPDMRPLLDFLTKGVSPDPMIKQWTEYREIKQVEEAPKKMEFDEESVVEAKTNELRSMSEEEFEALSDEEQTRLLNEPYRCSYCGAEFRRLGVKMRHIADAHKVESI